jgi:hypothetical protein
MKCFNLHIAAVPVCKATIMYQISVSSRRKSSRCHLISPRMSFQKLRPPPPSESRNAPASRLSERRKKTLVPKTHQSHVSRPNSTSPTHHANLPFSSPTQAMLASPFYHAQQQQTPPPSYHQREFLPKIPSPLSPRSANIPSNGTARPIFMSDNLNKPQSPSPVPYAKRAIKRAPVVSQDALKERRRGMFLKKVREGREDKRFEKHGEDVSILFALDGFWVMDH